MEELISFLTFDWLLIEANKAGFGAQLLNLLIVTRAFIALYIIFTLPFYFLVIIHRLLNYFKEG